MPRFSALEPASLALSAGEQAAKPCARLPQASAARWTPLTRALSMRSRYSRREPALRAADGGEYTYYAPGVEHIAFQVDTREEVEGAHRRAVEMGAKVHFPPEEDKDIEGYYATFVFDPDGIRIEVFREERPYRPE